MYHSNSRARRQALSALVFAALTTVTACAHSQQTPPADSPPPRGQGGYQGQGGPGMQRDGRRGDSMLEGLNLTQDQRSQITLIRDRYRLKADSLRMGGAPRDSTTRSAFRSVMQQEMAEIRGVLTPDQQKQFDDRMAKMRERRRDRGGNEDGNGPPPPRGDNPPPPPPPAK